MNKKRCALVAAVVVVVCTVAYLCWTRFGNEAEEVVAAASAPSVKTAGAVSSAVAPGTGSMLQFPSNQTATVRGTKPYVLVSEVRFDKSLRLAAEALGARTIGVKSAKALLVEADPEKRARLEADGRFSSVGEFHPIDKVSDELAAAIRGGADFVETGILTLTPEDHEAVQARVVAMGGEILKGCLNDGGIFRAKLPAGRVVELASCGDIRWLELFVRPRLTNDVAVDQPAMNVRTAWLSDEDPENLEGLSGEGQVISTSDSGIDSGNLDTLHEDLRDRVCGFAVVEGCDKKDSNGHGTHTAGSIVGNGKLSDGRIRGSAWGAQLWAWFCGAGGGGISTPKSMADLFRPDPTNNIAYIHSASWGSSAAGSYTSQCLSLDKYVWNTPDFLPVFSAGNDGCNMRTGEIIEGTIGSPAAAKNVLAVGATQNLRTEPLQIVRDQYGEPVMILENGEAKVTAEYSSRGPCKDGRIKPDIATPGTGVLSTRSYGVDYSYGICTNYYGVFTNGARVVTNEWYAYDTGTSMACPLMAGSVALVREWLTRDQDPLVDPPPTAALMKAIVTGGAKDAPIPNNDQGWGRFDLQETLFPSNRAVHLEDRIPFEPDLDFAWIVETTNTAPLDVQLAWVDYPAEPGDEETPKLINDLDLTVERLDGGNGTVFYGNGGNKPDELNNLESVRIASAEPTRYLVTVNCKNVLFDHTEGGAAALYIRGAFDPEAVTNAPPRVRIRETGAEFRVLDKALDAVQPGQTVEILEPVKLRWNTTVMNSCTITATNASPWASMVTCLRGAELSITNGAAVTFENVAFEPNGGSQVRVFSNSVARLSGAFGLDRIRTDNWRCLELATVITNAVEVDCLTAPGNSSPKNYAAWSALDPVTMSKSANHLLFPFDDERGGIATAGSAFGKDVPTLIVWQQYAPVPDAAAAVRLQQEPGVPDLVNYRTLSALMNHISRSGAPTAYVYKDTVLTNEIDVSDWNLIIASTNGNYMVDPSDCASFRVGENGSLMITNMTFSGRKGSPFITVDGGVFTLENGASLEDLDGSESDMGQAAPGAVMLQSGTMTMRPGSSILRCSAPGPNACGGAIYVWGAGCVLNLEGGTISGCSASSFGGGIYIYDYLGPAEVNLSGPLTIYGNTSRNSDTVNMFDDIHGSSGADFTLRGDLTGGRVGLSYMYDMPYSGDAFISNAVGANVSDHTLASFTCEDLFGYEEDQEAAVSADGESLIWVDAVYDPDTVRTADHVAQIVREGGAVTNYFQYLDGLNGAFATIDEDGLAVELLNSDYVIDLYETIPVEHEVTLRLADEVASMSDAVVYRAGECGFKITSGGKLTVDGVDIRGTFAGQGRNNGTPLLYVEGGELVLTNGTAISGVLGSQNRASNAVAVSDGGTFTMTEGTSISNCENSYKNDGDQTGVGAALLVDNGTAYLRGGMITGNKAYRAAGVSIGNEGVAYVSGNMIVKNNTKTSGGVTRSDFAIEERGQLCLDGFLVADAAIGIEDGIPGQYHDTNVFGRVSDRLLPEISDYVPSARRFFRDDKTKITGRIVTNATEALLVWSYAAEGGAYTNAKGVVYGIVNGPTEINPPIAKTGLTYTGNVQTGVVEGVGYALTGNTATDVGTYTAVATLEEGYIWRDGTREPKEIVWSIAEAPVPPPGPTPHWEVVTTNPTAIAFKSIERVSDTEWTLVITDRVAYCNYRLIWTKDLAQGFTETGKWEHAVGPAAAPVWTTNVITTGGAWFWRAEGKDGTNMVLKTGE